MEQFVIFLLLPAILIIANGASLPSGINACKISDEECLKNAGTAAIKVLKEGNESLGIDKFSPILFKKIYIPAKGGEIDITQDFDDVTFSGFGSAEVTKMKVDFTGDKCMIDLETINQDDTIFNGKYKFAGKLMMHALNGNGIAKVNFVKMRVVQALKCEKFKKDDDEYLKITEDKVGLFPAKVIYDFSNIAPGDEELGEEILKEANHNDLEVFNEIKDDYAEIYSPIFMSIMNQFFAKFPIKEIFLT